MRRKNNISTFNGWRVIRFVFFFLLFLSFVLSAFATDLRMRKSETLKPQILKFKCPDTVEYFVMYETSAPNWETHISHKIAQKANFNFLDEKIYANRMVCYYSCIEHDCGINVQLRKNVPDKYRCEGDNATRTFTCNPPKQKKN